MLSQMALIARNRTLWIGFCLSATIVTLVLFDWSTEQAAWAELSDAGVPTWAIMFGIALAWVRNAAFWGWMFIVGLASWRVWRWAQRNDAVGKQPQTS